MRTSFKVAMAVVSVAAALTLAGVGIGVASGSSSAAPKPALKVLNVTVGPEKKKAPAGWQGVVTFSTGSAPTYGALFYHYSCPAGRIADNGAFTVSSLSDPSYTTIQLVGNQPRADITPLYSQWGWSFYWIGGTAPANSTLDFNVYCK
jgi:hypothetical protein